MKKAVLVYQGGIANVFDVDCFNLAPYREVRRLLQASFSECETFARGLKAAGVIVKSAYCNMAGDIADQKWSSDLDNAPFSDEFRVVGTTN